MTQLQDQINAVRAQLTAIRVQLATMQEQLDQEAEAKLLALIKEANDGWVPNWEDEDQPKYYLLEVENTGWDCNVCYISGTLPDAYYFKSREVGKQLFRLISPEFLEDALL